MAIPILRKRSHMSPYLDNESFLWVARTRNYIYIYIFLNYFTVWAVAKFGSLLLWMIADRPCWQNFLKRRKKKTLPLEVCILWFFLFFFSFFCRLTSDDKYRFSKDCNRLAPPLTPTISAAASSKTIKASAIITPPTAATQKAAKNPVCNNNDDDDDDENKKQQKSKLQKKQTKFFYKNAMKKLQSIW